MAATFAKIITTTLGPVEVVIYGTNTPVLIIHGSPSGVDAARSMCRFLPEAQFQSICVSRPGYLGTPLSTNHDEISIDHEADLLAAVLDTLDIQRAGVLAWSGGGPSAYRFAIRHPDRVSAMVMIAACSSRWVAPKPSFFQDLMFGTGMGERFVAFLSDKAAGHVVKGALEGEGSVRGEDLRLLAEKVMADDRQRLLVLGAAQTVNTAGRRKSGWENDVANFAQIEDLELERVQCSVLLVHGDADTDASIEHSRVAHTKLHGSTLVVMSQGTHLCFYAHSEAPQVQEQARRWLLEDL